MCKLVVGVHVTGTRLPWSEWPTLQSRSQRRHCGRLFDFCVGFRFLQFSCLLAPFSLHSCCWCCPRSAAHSCTRKLLHLRPSAEPPPLPCWYTSKITPCTPNKVKFHILFALLTTSDRVCALLCKPNKNFACCWLCASRASRQKFSNRDCGAASHPTPTEHHIPWMICRLVSRCTKTRHCHMLRLGGSSRARKRGRPVSLYICMLSNRPSSHAASPR